MNGLGSGAPTQKDRLVLWWWRRVGLRTVHAHIDWYDGASLQAKVSSIEQHVKNLLQQHAYVVMIGSSAGASLALNVFARIKNEPVCVVCAHGRVGTGRYRITHRNSLYRRAGMATARASQAFYDGVMLADGEVIPTLSVEDKSRILVLTQLTDLVVPPHLMRIEGARTHRSFAFGHGGGFLAHIFADRDLIVAFARDRLKQRLDANRH